MCELTTTTTVISEPVVQYGTEVVVYDGSSINPDYGET